MLLCVQYKQQQHCGYRQLVSVSKLDIKWEISYCSLVKNGECEELIKMASWQLTSGPTRTWRQGMEGLHFVLLISRECKFRGSWSDYSGVLLARLVIAGTTRPRCCCCQQAGAPPADLLSSASFQPFDTVGPPDISKFRLGWPQFFYVCLQKYDFVFVFRNRSAFACRLETKYFTVFIDDSSWLVSFQQTGLCCQCHQLEGPLEGPEGRCVD